MKEIASRWTASQPRIRASLRYADAAFEMNDLEASFDSASKHLRVSRSVFYNQFANRRDLMSFALDHYEQTLIKTALEAVASRPPIEGLTHTWVSYMFETLLRNINTAPRLHWLVAWRLGTANITHQKLRRLATLCYSITSIAHARHTDHNLRSCRMRTKALISFGILGIGQAKVQLQIGGGEIVQAMPTFRNLIWLL